MGAMCTPKQPKQNPLTLTPQKIEASQCKHLIFQYIDHYGKQVTMDLIDWIDRSYDRQYTSNVFYLRYPSAVKLKRDLSASFETLYNGGWTARFDRFLKISLTNGEELIQYEMVCNGPVTPGSSERRDCVFRVLSMFTKEGKFKISMFKQIT